MTKKYQQRKLCSQPRLILQTFDKNISSSRMRFIMSSNKKWVNGTELTYMFIEGAKRQQDVVRQAFKKWKSLGIGISFTEVMTKAEAMIRIGFDHSDGSWSYVGRDVLTIPKKERTMNFGWDLTDAYGMTTALHEIGHTIGFQHEHQSPFTGIEWNTAAVYKEFSGEPNNWSKGEIDRNILDKISPNQVRGSNWDAKSIMQYEFGPGLIKKPLQFKNGIFPPGVLSKEDIKGIKQFYPVLAATRAVTSLKVLQSEMIGALSGEQADFAFTAPLTKKYTFQTFGEMDTVMVVSEKDKKKKHYLSGDDDSGQEKNTKITLPLVKGRQYIINVRVMYAAEDSGAGIVVY